MSWNYYKVLRFLKPVLKFIWGKAPEGQKMYWKVQKVVETAKLPEKAHWNDAGWDLFAAEDVDIPYGEVRKVRTGIKGQLPAGHFAMLRDRSSIGSKGVIVTAGIIDEGFRSEILICMLNLCKNCTTYSIKAGDKIAQALILPVPTIVIVEGSLDDSERGEKGFGSSG